VGAAAEAALNAIPRVARRLPVIEAGHFWRFYAHARAAVPYHTPGGSSPFAARCLDELTVRMPHVTILINLQLQFERAVMIIYAWPAVLDVFLTFK